MTWLAVGVGGAAGSLARHCVNVFFGRVLERAIPYATGTVNLVGSLVIGLLAGLIATGRLQMSTGTRTFVFVGLLGGFTTFSSFMLDTFTIGQGGEQALAFWNVVLQTTLGLVAVWAGYRMAAAFA
jgi:CrcB protein